MQPDNEKHWVEGPRIDQCGDKWAVAGVLSGRPYIISAEGKYHASFESSALTIRRFDTREQAEQWITGGAWK